MSERFYWENGVRVPVTMPDYDVEPEVEVDSPALVMMRTLIGILLESPDVRLELECLSLISSVGYDGKSLADIARENMTTRALVSRRCVDLCKTLGVPPVRAMRNESGQENCRKARIKKIEEEIKNYHSK